MSIIGVLEGYIDQIQPNTVGIGLQYARMIYTQQHMHRKCMKSSHNTPKTSSYCNQLDSAHYKTLKLRIYNLDTHIIRM